MGFVDTLEAMGSTSSFYFLELFFFLNSSDIEMGSKQESPIFLLFFFPPLFSTY